MKQSFSLKIYLFGYEKTDLKYEWKIYHVHKGEQNQLENPILKCRVAAGHETFQIGFES